MSLTADVATSLISAPAVPQSIIDEAIPTSPQLSDTDSELVFVKHLLDPRGDGDHAVGIIVMASPATPGWVMNDGVRFTGSRLNPPPVNGSHYRIISHNGANRRLVRYNDDSHVSDRVLAHCPWSIVEDAPGIPAAIVDGYGSDTLHHPYIEVQYPAGEEAAEGTVGIPTEEAAIPTWIRRTSHMEGCNVAADGGGMVRLNPVRVPGRLYYVISAGNEDYGGLAIFGSHGSFFSAPGAVAEEPAKWVEVAEAAESESASENSSTELLLAELVMVKTRYRDFRVALNTTAREMSWCEEYEESMQRLGLMDPDHTRRTPIPEIGDDGEEIPAAPETFNYNVKIGFSATISDDSPSGRLDSALMEYWPDGVSSSDLRFDMNGSVTILVEDAEDAAAAEGRIDHDMVTRAIESELSRGEVSELHDWNVDSSEEVEAD